MNEFILNDESIVNAYGFRVLNAGADLNRFRENPVMLLEHESSEVIGKWENLRFENGKMLATPVFDKDDAEGARVAGQVERGFLKGASIGMIPLKWQIVRDQAGKEEEVLMEWELLEVSVVSIPANKGALRLYHKSGKPMTAEEIKLSIEHIKKEEKHMNVFKLTLAAYATLGVQEGAEISDLNDAIVALGIRAKKAEETLQAKQRTEIALMIDGYIQSGRLDATKKEHFVKLGLQDMEMVKGLLEALPTAQSLNTQVQAKTETEDRSDWTYMDWLQKDKHGLTAMKRDHPEQFLQLHQSYTRVTN